MMQIMLYVSLRRPNNVVCYPRIRSRSDPPEPWRVVHVHGESCRPTPNLSWTYAYKKKPRHPHHRAVGHSRLCDRVLHLVSEYVQTHHHPATAIAGRPAWGPCHIHRGGTTPTSTYKRSTHLSMDS